MENKLTIHEVENDKSVVLVEISVPLLMAFMCAHGHTSTTTTQSQMEYFRYSKLQSTIVSRTHEGLAFYNQMKSDIMTVYDKYLDSISEGPITNTPPEPTFSHHHINTLWDRGTAF